MKVRLGYVAIAKRLGKKVTSSSTVTYKNFSKIIGENNRKEKLKAVTLSNLNDLERIIKYNIENNIHFYRITSALIPLVTHPEVGYWGHREIFKKEFQHIGKLIRESKMRVDTHPDEFNVLNSIKPNVVENTKINLLNQVQWFEDLSYPEGKMVIHVGGATGGKEKGLERFAENFKTFPDNIKSRLIIENDDKTYTAKEVLYLCNILNIPMVLDIHHHNCNNNGEDITNFLSDVFDTWNNEILPPKLHFSTPREFENDRRHADYIDAISFIEFLEKAKEYNRDIDIMLECKEKDEALHKLREDIKVIRPQYTWLDESTIEI